MRRADAVIAGAVVLAGALAACSARERIVARANGSGPTAVDDVSTTPDAGRDASTIEGGGGAAIDTDAAARGRPGAATDGGDAARTRIEENPGALDDATKAALRGGGDAAPSLRFMYPYDDTVFPRGLGAPAIELSLGPFDAAYVHVLTPSVDYDGFFAAQDAGAPAVLTLPAATWTRLAASLGDSGGDMTVAVTVTRGGAVTGPIEERWRFASEPLPGAITYSSLGARDDGGSAIVRWTQRGGATTLAAQSGCIGCHAVSADGATLVASYGDNASGALFDARSGARVRDQADSLFTWGALSPDGALLLSNGALDGGFPPNVSGQTQGPRASRLYDVKSGAPIAAPGWDDRVSAALMPVFSPSGKKVAFNHYDTGQGKSIAVMDFDAATHAFANLVDVATTATPTPTFLGWPTFTPDDQWVVFQGGSREDYASEQGGLGDLAIAPAGGGRALVPLDVLNGIANGAVYLPWGYDEAHLNFWPSISPRAAGGYFWVAFTSRRMVGVHTPNATADDRVREKIWIAAIEESPSPGLDPSHPAFLMPDQAMGSGNVRPVWTAAP